MLDLDDATANHVDWLGRLMHALQSNHDITDLCRETADRCSFGLWLAEQRAAGQSLSKIDRVHRSMHDIALTLLQHRRKDEEYFATLDRFCETAIEFNRLLSSLAPRRCPGTGKVALGQGFGSDAGPRPTA